MPLRAGTLPSYQKIRRPGSGTGFRPCRGSDFVSALIYRPLGQDLAFWIRFRLIGAQNFPIWDPHTSVGIFGGPSRAWTLHTSDPCASTFHIMGHGYVPYNDAPQNSLSGLVRPSSLQPQSIKAHDPCALCFKDIFVLPSAMKLATVFAFALATVGTNASAIGKRQSCPEAVRFGIPHIVPSDLQPGTVSRFMRTRSDNSSFPHASGFHD